MSCYADYDFYKSDYRGNMTEDEFNRHIIKASAYVRRITFGRADANAENDEIKLSACAVCDVFAADEKRRAEHQGQNILSENNDGYSVSFAQEQYAGETSEELLYRKAYKAAEIFLIDKGLLDLGA